nr:hypothetical protein [Streptomyces sp. Wb2n-11]
MLARHLVAERGVRHLVLTSRRGVEAPGRLSWRMSCGRWVRGLRWRRVMWLIVRRWPACWRRCRLSFR